MEEEKEEREEEKGENEEKKEDQEVQLIELPLVLSLIDQMLDLVESLISIDLDIFFYCLFYRIRHTAIGSLSHFISEIKVFHGYKSIRRYCSSHDYRGRRGRISVGGGLIGKICIQ